MNLQDLELTGEQEAQFNFEADQIERKLDRILEGSYLPAVVMTVLSLKLLQYMAAQTVSEDADQAERLRRGFLEVFTNNFETMTREMDDLAKQSGVHNPH